LKQLDFRFAGGWRGEGRKNNLGDADRNGQTRKMTAAEKGLKAAYLAEKRKRQAAQFEAWVRKAYANYKKQDYKAIEEDIISATKAGFGGSGYSVEFFPNGQYRTLWDGNIGNLYETPGVIVGLPQLGDDEWDDSDPSSSFFDNALEELDSKVEELIRQNHEGIE
jgi:hypothetical protein